jgi:exodeoxyribonuclease VII large subunit
MIFAGRVTTYPARSKYQLIISNAYLSADGVLLQRIELLKQKLKAEGLFEAKRSITMPERVGVITSASGAVIEDLKTQFRRCIPIEVIFIHASVQGESALQEIADAMRQLEDQVDVIVIARGGGSADDLRIFNEEQLVRSIAGCKVPVVSAIGHETDITLCDLVADLRAPTPTAAPIMILPLKIDELNKTNDHIKYVSELIERNAVQLKVQLDHHKQIINSIHKLCELHIQMLDYQYDNVQSKFQEALVRILPPLKKINLDWVQTIALPDFAQLLRKFHLELQNRFIQVADPDAILKQGFCMLKDTDSGRYITSVQDAPDVADLVLQDGEVRYKKM